MVVASHCTTTCVYQVTARTPSIIQQPLQTTSPRASSFPAMTTPFKSARLYTLFPISFQIHFPFTMVNFPFTMFLATPLPCPFQKAPYPCLRRDDLKFGLFLIIPTCLPVPTAPSSSPSPPSPNLSVLESSSQNAKLPKAPHSVHAHTRLKCSLVDHTKNRPTTVSKECC